MACRIRLAVVLGLFTGCFVDLPADPTMPNLCAGKKCSSNGYCNDGACYCSTNYVGNPYALYGCQPSGALSPCQTTCGLNALCEAGACRCVDGFVAVCGSGDCVPTRSLCDGSPDCANAADEDPQVCFDSALQEWSLVDDCDDGEPVRWRVWAQDRDWVWPNPSDAFVTDGFDLVSRQSIECIAGELLCFGAEAGDSQWGVGLDGRGRCDDCCQPCDGDAVDLGALACGT